jgi:hypothetical protein
MDAPFGKQAQKLFPPRNYKIQDSVKVDRAGTPCEYCNGGVYLDSLDAVNVAAQYIECSHCSAKVDKYINTEVPPELQSLRQSLKDFEDQLKRFDELNEYHNLRTERVDTKSPTEFKVPSGEIRESYTPDVSLLKIMLIVFGPILLVSPLLIGLILYDYSDSPVLNIVRWVQVTIVVIGGPILIAKMLRNYIHDFLKNSK